MLIDWFTVAAQTLNFIILVWLMKRVLYKPIMAAIEARETLVAAELADAAQKKAGVESAQKDLSEKNAAFDRDRVAALAAAVQEAKMQGAKLLDAARSAADALQLVRRDSLQREVKDCMDVLGRCAQGAFFTMARRALKDVANGSLEEQVTSVFCERLRAMKQEDKDKFGAPADAPFEPATLRSAFALPPKLREALQSVINETFQRQMVLRYDVAPDLISGIEFTAQGQRLAWSIADYLAELERNAADALRLAVPTAVASTPADQGKAAVALAAA